MFCLCVSSLNNSQPAERHYDKLETKAGHRVWSVGLVGQSLLLALQTSVWIVGLSGQGLLLALQTAAWSGSRFSAEDHSKLWTDNSGRLG